MWCRGGGASCRALEGWATRIPAWPGRVGRALLPRRQTRCRGGMGAHDVLVNAPRGSRGHAIRLCGTWVFRPDGQRMPVSAPAHVVNRIAVVGRRLCARPRFAPVLVWSRPLTLGSNLPTKRHPGWDGTDGYIAGNRGNLSDETAHPANDAGSGDPQANRTCTVEADGSVTCNGTHLRVANTSLIQLIDFHDTGNNGGVCTLAICAVGAADFTFSPVPVTQDKDIDGSISVTDTVQGRLSVVRPGEVDAGAGQERVRRDQQLGGLRCAGMRDTGTACTTHEGPGVTGHAGVQLDCESNGRRRWLLRSLPHGAPDWAASLPTVASCSTLATCAGCGGCRPAPHPGACQARHVARAVALRRRSTYRAPGVRAPARRPPRRPGREPVRRGRRAGRGRPQRGGGEMPPGWPAAGCGGGRLQGAQRATGAAREGLPGLGALGTPTGMARRPLRRAGTSWHCAPGVRRVCPCRVLGGTERSRLSCSCRT